jgi:drug/metabolite transporter (DMT)-like permease
MSEAAGDTSLASRITGNPWLLLTFSTLLWGGNVVAARWAVGEVSPMVLVGLRWIIVCTLILLYLRGRARAMFEQLRPHWVYLLLMGVFGFTISNAMLYEGARFTSGVNVAIIQGVLPVLVLAGARMVYGTHVGLVRMVGVAMTIGGILLIASEGEPARLLDLQINKGDFFAFLSAALYAGFTLALRKRPPMSALAFFIGLAFAALVTSVPSMAVEAMLGDAIWPSWRGVLVLVYVATCTSIIGQICWISAVEMIGPGRAGVFQNLVPVSGAILSVLLLRETFHWHHAASLALVLTGLFISERGKR